MTFLCKIFIYLYIHSEIDKKGGLNENCCIQKTQLTSDNCLPLSTSPRYLLFMEACLSRKVGF